MKQVFIGMLLSFVCSAQAQYIQVNRRNAVPSLSVAITPVCGNVEVRGFLPSNHSDQRVKVDDYPNNIHLRGTCYCEFDFQGSVFESGDRTDAEWFDDAHGASHWGSFSTGGYFDYVKLWEYNAGVVTQFTIDLNPFTTPYLSGCEGNTTQAALIYSGSVSLMRDAVRIVTRNALCALGYNKDDIFFPTSSFSNITFGHKVLNDPAAIHVGLDWNPLQAQLRYTLNGSTFSTLVRKMFAETFQIRNICSSTSELLYNSATSTTFNGVNPGFVGMASSWAGVNHNNSKFHEFVYADPATADANPNVYSVCQLNSVVTGVCTNPFLTWQYYNGSSWLPIGALSNNYDFFSQSGTYRCTISCNEGSAVSPQYSVP